MCHSDFKPSPATIPKSATIDVRNTEPEHLGHVGVEANLSARRGSQFFALVGLREVFEDPDQQLRRPLSRLPRPLTTNNLIRAPPVAPQAQAVAGTACLAAWLRSARHPCAAAPLVQSTTRCAAGLLAVARPPLLAVGGAPPPPPPPPPRGPI